MPFRISLDKKFLVQGLVLALASGNGFTSEVWRLFDCTELQKTVERISSERKAMVMIIPTSPLESDWCPETTSYPPSGYTETNIGDVWVLHTKKYDITQVALLSSKNTEIILETIKNLPRKRPDGSVNIQINMYGMNVSNLIRTAADYCWKGFSIKADVRSADPITIVQKTAIPYTDFCKNIGVLLSASGLKLGADNNEIVIAPNHAPQPTR